MLKFLLRRVATIPITFLVVTAVLYGIIMLSPAETRAQLYFPPRTRPFMPDHIYQNTLDRIIRDHGLDDPYPQQYLHWLSRLLRGEWGWSPTHDIDVLDALLRRTPATAELTLYSLLLLIPLGLVNGVVAAWKQDRLADRGFRMVAYSATSIPPFILGLVLLSIFTNVSNIEALREVKINLNSGPLPRSLQGVLKLNIYFRSVKYALSRVYIIGKLCTFQSSPQSISSLFPDLKFPGIFLRPGRK